MKIPWKEFRESHFILTFKLFAFKIVTIGWDVIGNNASLAYNYLSLLLLLLLLFTIRPLLQLLHTTANYQDSLVIQGFSRLLFLLLLNFFGILTTSIILKLKGT